MQVPPRYSNFSEEHRNAKSVLNIASADYIKKYEKEEEGGEKGEGMRLPVCIWACYREQEKEEHDPKKKKKDFTSLKSE